MSAWFGVIAGEPVSMKNSRRLVTVGRGRFAKPRVIKSDKALAYVASARRQLERMRIYPLLEGPLRLEGHLYYASNRPDLDESIVLDLLQGVVYRNDRQVRERHVYHGIDKKNPRAEVKVEVLFDQGHGTGEVG